MKPKNLLQLIVFVTLLTSLVLPQSNAKAIPIGFRTADPGPFLSWPLANKSLNAVSRLPNSQWTYNFLGITTCPEYPALIDAGVWGINGVPSGPGNRDKILPGVPDSRVKWMNANHGAPWNNAFACYSDGNGHAGTDIFASNGTNILAAAYADQVYVSPSGTNITLRHPNVNGTGQTWYTYYVHGSASTFPAGQTTYPAGGISSGTVIGKVGSGHLHFQVDNDGHYSTSRALNPFGIDRAPWNGCLFIDSSLCPSPSTDYSAAWDSQSPHPTITQGQSADVSVTFKNTGSMAWSNTGANPTHLGTTNPDTGNVDYNYRSPFVCPTWLGNITPANLSESTVPPGNNGTFNFKICVPADMTPGTYRISVAPLIENITWMIQPGVVVYWDIVVQKSGTRLDCGQVSSDGVILYEHVICNRDSNGGTKTFSSPTDWVDIVSDFNDITSSIYVSPGWSIKVFEHSVGYGISSWRCITGSMWDLRIDYYTNGNTGQVINDTISSVRVYDNTSCNNIPTPVFVYPVDGQTLDYYGWYLFKVEPIDGAQGYLWGFEQNDQLIWENWRDEGHLSGNEYGIPPGPIQSKFVPGLVKIIVRASVDQQWSEAGIIQILLDGSNPPDPPVAFSKSTPTNNATKQSTSPTLTWETSAGTTLYEYCYDTTNDNACGSWNNTGAVTSANLSGLTINTTYYWQVRAVNAGGTTYANTSSWWSFTTGTAPTLNSPVNGSTLLTNLPTFTWEAINGVTNYNIQVSMSSTFSKTTVNATTTTASYTPTRALIAKTLMYWRVRTKTGTVYNEWSEVRSFTTANPPSIPTLSAPANNALVTTLRPKFDWSNSTVPAGVPFDHYQIQVSNTNTFAAPVIDATTTVSNITNSDYTPTADLMPATTYYWRVRSWSAAGDFSGWSAVRSVRIAYAKPILIAPSGVIATLKPTFTWNSVPGATSYNIQVSKNSAFTAVVINKTVNTPSYTHTINLLAGTTYYWRVRVNGAYGPSSWSLTFQFRTQ